MAGAFDGIIPEMSVEQALRATLAFLDTGPDDSSLCYAAVTFGEPLVEWHWEALGEEFIRLAGERQDLRKMLSCCDFDDSVPAAFRERLYNLVGPDDDLGSSTV